MIRERQREGIALAKKAGVYKSRKPSLTAGDVAEIRRRVATGEKKAGLASEFKVSRQTLYTALGWAWRQPSVPGALGYSDVTRGQRWEVARCPRGLMAL